MALTPIPPWLDVGPSTYLGAAKAGAATGQAAADALNQYNIHQQQIAAESANAAAHVAAARESASQQHQAAMAAMALKAEQEKANNQLGWARVALAQDRQGALNDYRTRENDLRELGLNQRQAADALKHNYLHVGDQIIAPKLGADGKPLIGPDGKMQFDVLHDAGLGKLHPIDRMDYDAAIKARSIAAGKLAGGGLAQKDKDFWQGQVDAAENTLKSIRSRYPGSMSGSTNAVPSAATPLSQTDAGSLWDMFGGEAPTAPAWATPGAGLSLTPQGLPSMPSDSGVIDFGNPEPTSNEVRVLNIRPKQ